MLHSFQFKLLKSHTARAGTAILLGDQQAAPSLGRPIRDALRSLGHTSIITIDYDGTADILHDLNYPLDSNLKADLFFDGGVIEHVANAGQCLSTCVNLTKVGGLLMQTCPLNCYGASYYGIDPLLLRDFYRSNGFEELSLQIVDWSNWRTSLIYAASRIPSVAEFVRKQGWGKSILLEDPQPSIFTVAPGWIEDPKYLKVPFMRKVPLTSHVLYLGVRTQEVPLRWPAQRDYPKAE